MPWTTKKNKAGEICVFKEGTDGKPVGESLGCHPSREKANKQLAALYASEGKALTGDELGAIKCWDEMEYVYVPYGLTTLQAAFESEDARDNAKHLSHVVEMYKGVIDNIISDPEIDKAKAIKNVASELAGLVEEIQTKGDKHEKSMDSVPTQEVPDHMLIKSLGNDRVGAYAVMWGSEVKKDLTEEYFDKSTLELTSIFDTVGRLPYIYHHALDDTLKTRVIGVVDVLRADDIGLWYESQLKLADDYDQQIKKLLEEGKLKTSSQTFPSARRVSKTGHIERWPIIEITATPTPAEYRMQPVEFLKTAYAELGTDLDGIIKRYDEDTQGAEKARASLALKRLRLLSI